ncbi:hypothetical protein ALP30_200140 [Pseudomonas syringae pv. primulae]|nr:fumarate--(S)-2,3-diaminopropanoate ligase [Pseudomonas syringae group genomosp. 3]RMU34014.1 hypothetical protein ALP30_200140 [Pseudomonas syringae pv. primulae]
MDFKILAEQMGVVFPWYKQLLVEKKVNVEDLQTFPLITEELLTKYYYHAEHKLTGHSHSYLTSGTSSGKRKRIIYSDQDQHIYLQQRFQIIKNFCGNTSLKACADLGTGHAAATAGEIFQKMGCEVELIDFSQPIDVHIEVLNRFKPDIIFTMPMILDSLIATGQLDFKPQKIILLGDVASQVWQQKVAEYFYIKSNQILDLFGSIEIGSIAFFNHEIECYQFDSYIFPEVVPVHSIYPDSTYQGEGGILLITSFAREFFPSVRFVTNDLIEGFAQREYHGETIFTYKRCLGRFADEFKHGEKINLSDISDAIANNLPYHKFDLDDKNGGLVIRIVADLIESKIVDAIKNELLARNPDVAQMIRSGLVKDIAIQCVDESQINGNVSKRRY